MRSWLRKAVHAVSADLAVHGLAYLGVLLVFAGVFGFVAFAFGDVQVELRPVAEVAIPLTFFVAAWALRRRDIRVVSAALELLGGAVLPVIVIASLSDGASVPPDLTGTGLVFSLMAALLLVSGAYALVTLRRPDSPLRYLAAPAAWLAVAAVGLLFAPSIPSRSGLSHPYAGEWALVSGFVALSLVACRAGRRSATAGSRFDALRQGTIVAAGPGIALALLLTFVSAPGEGWPVAPIVTAGIATVLALELLATRPLDVRLVAVLQGLTLYATAFMLGPPLSPAWSGTIAAVGALLLFEWHQRHHPVVSRTIALFLWLPGIIVGAAAALAQPVPTLVAWSTAWAWAVARHTRPGTAPLPSWIPMTVIAVSPIAMASGVGRLTTPGWSLFALAALVLSVAAIVRITAITDTFWAAWIPSAAALVWLLVVGVPEQELAVATAIVLAMAFALAPRWPVLRVWTTAVAASTAFTFAASAWSWSPTTVTLLLSGTGIVLVALASWRREAIFGHIGLIGLLSTMVAIGTWAFSTSMLEWVHVASIGVAALGWLVTTILNERKASSIGELLDRMALSTRPSPPPDLGPLGQPITAPPVVPPARAPGDSQPAPSWMVRAARAVPPLFTIALSLLFTAAAVELSGMATTGSARNANAVLVAVLVWALLARLLSGRHRELSGVVANASLWFGLVAAIATFTDSGMAAVGSLLLIATIVVVGPQVRPGYFWWVATTESAIAVVAGAIFLGLPTDDVRFVVMGWAAAAMIGALAIDDVRDGRRRAGELVRRPALRAPSLLGAVAFIGALLTSYWAPAWQYGWASAAGAAAVAVVAWQLHWGILSGASWILATVAYGALAPWHPVTEPWTFLPVIALMVLESEAVAMGRPRSTGSATEPERLPSWVARWDAAALVAAHLVALFALGAAAVDGALTATWCGIGAISLALDVRRRTGAWAAVGTGLVLTGAAAAGAGWLSLALLATSVAAGVLASFVPVRARPVLQAVNVLAGSGAFVAALVWRDADVERAAIATSVAVTVTALTLAALSFVRIDRNWIIAWSSVIPVGLAYSAIALGTPGVAASPSGQVLAIAVAATAVALAMAARRFGQAGLRYAAAVVLGLAAAPLAYGTGASAAQITVTASVVGAVAGAASLSLRRLHRGATWIGPAAMLGAGGFAVAAVAGAVAGPGWLALASAEIAVAALVVSILGPLPLRLASTGLGVVATATSWVTFVSWQDWSLSTIATETALLAGAVALTISAALHRDAVDRVAAGIWGALVPVGIAFSSWALFDPTVPRSPAGYAVAAGYFATAAASVIARKPTGQDWLRESCAALSVIGGLALAYGSGATAAQVTVAASIAGLAAITCSAVPVLRPLAGPWLRPLTIFAFAGLGVAAIAGAVAGAGWLALALLAVAAGASVFALLVHQLARTTAVAVSIAAAVGAWASLVAWQSWDLDQTVTASALLAAGTAAVLGTLFRVPRVDQLWIALWSVVPASILLCTTVGLASSDVERWPAAAAISVAYAAVAIAAALAAGPTGQSWLRETAALLLVAAGASLAYATSATSTQIVLVSATVGLLATLSVAAIDALASGRFAFLHAWERPMLLLSVAGLCASIGTALSQWPERPLLVASLLLLGIDMAALGLRGRWPTLLTLAPVPIGIAWLVFASEALTGDAQWFTVPTGLVLLAIVASARLQRRRAGKDPVTAPIIALDLLGSVLIVSAALVETVTTSLAYGLLALVLGIAIAVWGVLTRVRRRLVFGTTTVALAVALMIVVPMAGLVPQWGGPALWLALVVIGLAAILIAAFLEQGRATARRVLRSVRDLTRGWEGWTTHGPSSHATA